MKYIILSIIVIFATGVLVIKFTDYKFIGSLICATPIAYWFIAGIVSAIKEALSDKK